MTEGRIVKPLSVFIVVLVVILGGTVVLALAAPGASGPPDGQQVDGQSPSQFRPDALNSAVDPEDGSIAVDTADSGKRILVETSHSNQYERADLEPVVEAMFEAGHTVEFGTGGAFAANLSQYDGVLVIQPLARYTPDEREALREYTDEGGRVVVLAEPTQTSLSTGFLTSSTTTVAFGANNATAQYGVRMGAEQLYNVDDEANDNNFKSIYATPDGDGPLTDGVERVTFDSAGYAVVARDAETETAISAVEGTRTLETRRTGTYPVVVRNDNVVFVADASFVAPSEVYDADNEVFVSNLLAFLAGGEATGGGATPGGNAETGAETPATDSDGTEPTPLTPTPEPTATPVPTPGADT
ncbi:DUF4350 domain-containing protein [Haloarcula salina]|uniref:DUF4350 domain-containing protein n=1 Tax=Haloarcula salina TaxID=1429914 RepID=A0AA41G3G0_9EURY|nr:DUF4350 domain-containing protein [Haloarcula salina]MBV0903613.1 DUF4350 domain-containing protein [Haloarcula salina]